MYVISIPPNIPLKYAIYSSKSLAFSLKTPSKHLLSTQDQNPHRNLSWCQSSNVLQVSREDRATVLINEIEESPAKGRTKSCREKKTTVDWTEVVI